MDTIARQVVAAREALGYTQAQLAERVPCNPQTVSNWETGRRQPRYADLVRLAEILRRPVSWFLGEAHGDEGLREVADAFERIRRDLEGVGRLLQERTAAPTTAGADQLAPVAGCLVPGPLAQLQRGDCGWRWLAAAQAEGVLVVRVEGDAHHPLLRAGDLLGIAAATDAEPGRLVLVETENGAEVLWRLAADGSYEAVNPIYAPWPAGAGRVSGVVRWLQRDFEAPAEGADGAAAQYQWLTQAEREVELLEQRIERGDGDWAELRELCERIAAATERLRPVYGASVVTPAAKAMARSARSLGEQGRYADAVVLARQAESLYHSVEQVGERSRDALNNLYNLSQLALFCGQLDEARTGAELAAGCSDWTVRWKALKNLAELDVNFAGGEFDERLCADILDLAEQHRAADPVQAGLAAAVAHEIRGNAWFTRGDVARARAEATEELAAAEAAGLPYREANALLNLAHYAWCAGDSAAAAAALARAGQLTAAQELGDLEAMRLAHAAAVAALDGRWDEATAVLHQSQRLATRIASLRGQLFAELAGLCLAQRRGDSATAADHAAAARELAATMGMVPYRAVIERMVAETR